MEKYPDTKGKFSEEAYVSHIKEKYRIINYAESFYVYANGYYENYNEKKFKVFLKDEIMPGQRTTANVNKLYEALSIEHGIHISNDDPRIEPKEWICFKNCLYNPYTCATQPHTPNIIYLTQRPFNYNPDAEIDDLTQSFFENCVKGYEGAEKDKARELLFQVIGVVLSSIRPKAFVFIQGRKKDTGKSSFCGVIQKLLGDKNYSSVPIELMTEAGFSLSTMIGKPANIVTETSNETLRNAHITFLKKVTGGANETVHINIKGVTPQEVILKTFLIFAGNNMPECWSNGNMDAFIERLILIDFIGQLTDEEKIQDIAERLNYEYIILEAMKALNRFVQANNAFTIPNSVKEHRKKLKNSNPVNGFLDDCDLSDSLYQVHAKTLFEIFNKWCNDNGCPTNMSNISFNKRLEENGVLKAEKKIRETEGNQSPYIGFIGIKPPSDYHIKYLAGWGTSQNTVK